MRSGISFVKLSALAGFAALLVLAGLGTTGANASPLQSTATMMSTMSAGGAYPPCPAVIPAAASTMSATMAGTMMPTMMSTMAATMMPMPNSDATMIPFPTAAATMLPFPTAAATMPMIPTMSAADMFNGSLGCQLTGTFSGTIEVPPGDPNAGGTVLLKISRPATGPGEVCYQIKSTGLKNYTASHIHKAPVGVAGPVVVPFTKPDATGMVTGCVQNVDATLINDILTHPYNYYVNVHTTQFPGGAGRAQLSAAATTAQPAATAAQ